MLNLPVAFGKGCGDLEVFGSIIAILLVAGLVFVCARELWGPKKAGGCAGCAGGCAGCSGACHGNSKCTKLTPEMQAKYEEALKRAKALQAAKKQQAKQEA